MQGPHSRRLLQECFPAGAEVFQDGPKSGVFEWTPTPDQVAAAERWTIPLTADDGDHPPTELDYIVVLRTEAKPGCPGDPPVVSITAPGDGERVASATGYQVTADVSDDMGLRDAPLLFYSTSAPDDPDMPDVTDFEQLVMGPSGGAWSARIPSLRLDDGAEQEVFVLVSATDNDDPSGASCDHRTDSTLRRFVAVGGEGGGELLATCEPCSESTQCASGLCATAADGARCVPGCSGDGACEAGSCGATVTTEGGVLAGCGPVDDVCGGGGGCTDDAREEDDTAATATPYEGAITDGQICADDPDHHALSVAAGTRVTVVLDGFSHAEGDLDLQLLDGDATIVGSSASTMDVERVEHCFPEADTATARVLGYDGAENGYGLSMTTEPDPAMCCVDDAAEENDDRASATALSFDGDAAPFDGTICPRDDDFFRFEVDGPAQIQVTLLIEEFMDADLDLQLLGPTGAVAGSSAGTGEEESIDVRVTDPGTYSVRVYGFLGDSSPYLGEVVRTADAGCSSSLDCPTDQVCDAGSCVDRTCSGSTCPADHICPDAGPSPTPSECGASCAFNRDCRSTEACKWFWEGRYCGRTGGGANGEACTTFADCGGQRACLPWPSGLCARAGCSSNSDCETDTFCVDAGDGFNVCAPSCWDGDDVCRTGDGHVCDILEDQAAELQLVCVPAS